MNRVAAAKPGMGAAKPKPEVGFAQLDVAVANGDSEPAYARAAAQQIASRQAGVGVGLAVLILGAWLAVHVAAVFGLTPQGATWWLAVPLLALQTWLGVGLFIVAHDAMHGSLAPGWPRLNAAIGQACLAAYAAFPYRRLRREHLRHHAAPGTSDDPDFCAERPTAFAAWLLSFLQRYFGWREFAWLTAVLAFYLIALQASPWNLLLFWALPAALSALQLFTFGTWLPHRHVKGLRPTEFADVHRARSLHWPWLASLLACFHFGLHLEHHRHPRLPWWALPRVRPRAALADNSA